ncbi:MAG: hypothetical protein JST59_20080 [Actinobacteria bacterium]|nr:hypothetical protein [Actinomycetota bacterium]
MELRCPDCLSPEVGPQADGPAGRLRCGNCGGRFERDEAFVSVAEAESRLPAAVPDELFEFDAERALAELEDLGGRLWAVEPDADADELNRLLDAAQTITVIRPRRERAWIHVYPLSIGEPDPLLAVDPGAGPALLGSELKLRREEGEDPRAFAVDVLAGVVVEANGLAAGRAADGERLDRIAAFLNRPGQWNGGDVCGFLADEIVASGRPLLDADE